MVGTRDGRCTTTLEQGKSGLIRPRDPFFIRPQSNLYAPWQTETCFPS